jgi:hypothetical protein
MKRYSPKVQEFIEKHNKLPKSPDEKSFLLICKEGADLAKHYPDEKSEIAYTIVAQGSLFGKSEEWPIYDIRQYAMSLEVPDYHVYVGDGVSITEKWNKIEQWAEEGLRQLDK